MRIGSAYPSLAQSDSIRLFKLSRSDLSRGRLYGRLTSVRLSDYPQYCAISYAWGEGSRTKHVVLSKDCAVDVSEPLFSGLLEIAREKEAKLIWVDQLCIRQADKHEKESQVALMSQIYGQAHLVNAWLGKPAVDTRLAFRLLKFFAAVSNETHAVVGRSEVEGHLPIPQDLVQELRLDHPVKLFAYLSNAAWQGAFGFVERPWFTRLWAAFANRAYFDG